MVDYVQTTIDTYEHIADEYVKQYVDRKPYQQLYNKFQKRLKGRAILDIGCGAGHDCAYFATAGLDVTGIDLSEKLLTHAKQNSPGVTFIQMDMRHLEFNKESFDGLWVISSFQHLSKADAPAALNGFRRVLKPTGVMYISVTAGQGEGMVKKDRYQGQAKFFANYSEAEITQTLEQAGWTILEIIPNLHKGKNKWIDIIVRPTH